MSKRLAVIDLGTNTFHLLVAEAQTDNTFKEIYRKRYFVKLAEEGIETIGRASLQRGMEALTAFKKIIQELEVHQVKAIGTAALRTASNGPSFMQQVKNQLGIQIELIDGRKEAAYIHTGVSLAVPFSNENYVLMDIGGGSVEFIIANKNKVHWAQSFPLGVGVLYKKFHRHEPILKEEIQATIDYVDSFLSPLKTALRQYPVSTLVGASGTFDVLEFILAKETFDTYARVAVAEFPPLYQRLLQSTKEERYAFKDIPDERADMIVVAVILIEYILTAFSIQHILVSKYAMKEGILVELLNLTIDSSADADSQ